VIVGPPAAGKTKVGRRIASRLGETFTDTDALITQRFGEIPALFAEHGEPWFREREREVIHEALSRKGIVSLGGGAVTHPHTRRDLADHRVLGLTISEEAVSSRILGNNKRPLLAGGLEAWKALVAARESWYREVSDHTIDVSHRDASGIAEEVTAWLRGVEGANG
jgi:shikimate kinase